MQSICLYFTKYDTDILAWTNMLRENRLSPATWVQAAIVSEYMQFKLDIGSVVPAPPTAPAKTALFGDDTGHTPNGQYTVGDRLNIRVTRKIVQEALERIVGENEMTAPVIKMILRKNIGCLSTLPNVPPDPMQLRDVFVRGMGRTAFVRPRPEPPKTEPVPSIEPAEPIKSTPPIEPAKPNEQPKPEKRKNPLLGYIS